MDRDIAKQIADALASLAVYLEAIYQTLQPEEPEEPTDDSNE